uniref:Integrase zinc-binding domain-containing protein n=1 Tax=Callorhinchus milii TaxID=7868 RepID=A0A4W3IZX4_CALMI
MTSEENYRAIVRYLTQRRRPYAGGTAEHTKRAIRKAAACYVYRDGLLLYQRRRRDSGCLDELEVVVDERRRLHIFSRCHVSPSGRHLSRDVTCRAVSNAYWWRGTRPDPGDRPPRPPATAPPHGILRWRSPPAGPTPSTSAHHHHTQPLN